MPGQSSTTKVHVAGVAPFIVTENDIPLTEWYAKRIHAVHTDKAGMFTLADLRIVIPQLITDARDKVAPTGVSLYYILHIGSIQRPSTPLSWWRRQARRAENAGATGGLAGRPILDIETFRQLLDLLDEVRAGTGLALTPEKTPDPDSDMPVLDAAYYEHYSPSRRCRGYLVLDPRFSLVIDCAEEDVRSLLTIVQQARLTDHGLATSGYAAVLMRVSLWDSNSDVQASLDDLVQLNRGGNASTRGQIVLSFALAGIGTLLALTQLPGARSGQLVAPMLIYALAAIVASLFALIDKGFLKWFSILFLLLATVLAIVMFVDPSFVVPLLPIKP